MTLYRLALLALPALLGLPVGVAQAQSPLTRAEKTDYRETSRYADVMQFLDTVTVSRPDMELTFMGLTAEDRAIPLVIVAPPELRTPARAHASGRLVVYLQANIHAGEVEGKEASSMLLREFAAGEHAALLEHLVLLVAPVYNADGNEPISTLHRTNQIGPEGGVGQRPNAMNLGPEPGLHEERRPGNPGRAGVVRKLGSAPAGGHAHHQRVQAPVRAHLRLQQPSQRGPDRAGLHGPRAAARGAKIAAARTTNSSTTAASWTGAIPPRAGARSRGTAGTAPTTTGSGTVSPSCPRHTRTWTSARVWDVTRKFVLGGASPRGRAPERDADPHPGGGQEHRRRPEHSRTRLWMQSKRRGPAPTRCSGTR